MRNKYTRRSLINKCVSCLLAGVLVLTGIVPIGGADWGSVAKAEEPEDALIASFDFDNADTGLKGAGAIARSNGTAVFSKSYAGAGNAISLNRENWLTVTKEDGSPLLAGLEEITISYDSRSVNYGRGWTFFAAPNTNRQTYQNEHYLGVMDMGLGMQVRVERYNCSGSRIGEPVLADSSNEWKHVDIVVTAVSTYLFIDGVQVGNESSNYKLSDIVGSSGGIIQIGKANWTTDGEYFNGLMDNLKIYGRAKAPSEITNADTDAEAAAKVVQALEIPNMDDIRGNIYLPKEVKGASVSWKSSDPSVITDEDKDGKAAGVVTRGTSDKKVTLTATVTKGSATLTKNIEVNVVKAPAPVSEDDYTGYLFGSFTGSEGNPMHEQIYFAAGTDGYNFKDLNNYEPVLVSKIGERGVRDPYILRSAEGDKFYLLATDLSIYYRGGWGSAAATTTGSRDLIIWESTDLVNWSEPRIADVGTLDAGCAWAPEAIYNEATGEYVVYFAQSHVINGDVDKALRIFAVKTRDFVNFSDAEEYIYRSDSQSIIDTTILKSDDGYYYRASGDGQITLERCTDLFGDWRIVTTLNDLGLGGNMTGGKLEGPELFRFNKKDWINGQPTYGLYTDQYADGLGYLPVITTNLNDANNSQGSWQKLSSNRYNFDVLKKRHGTILNLTTAEYERVVKAYGDDDSTEKQVDPADGILANFTFDDMDTGFVGGAAKAVGSGSISLADHDGGKAVYLNGSSFLTVTGKNGENLLSGHEELTISYDAKLDNLDSNNWIFYAAPNNNTQTYQAERYLGIFANNGTTTAERFRNSGSRPDSPSAYSGSDWAHVDVVMSKESTSIYVDNLLLSTVNSSISLIDVLGGKSIVMIGKANWVDGEYFTGWIDNFKIVSGVVIPDPPPSPTPRPTRTPRPSATPMADPGTTLAPDVTPEPGSDATPGPQDPSATAAPDSQATPNPQSGSDATPGPQATPNPKQGADTQQGSQAGNNSESDKVLLKVLSVVCKKNSRKITGKLSLAKAKVKIKVGKKPFKKAKVKGKKFTLKLNYKLAKKTKITIKATKKSYKTFKKKYVVK